MPRPPLKHRRANKNNSKQSQRAPSNAGLSNTPRVKLQQQLAKKVVGQKPQDSDDSDRLVTRTRHGRHTRSSDQVFASGAVAQGDKPGVFPSKQERMERLRSESNEIIRRSRSKSNEAAAERQSKSRSTSHVSDSVIGISRPATQTTLLPKSPPTVAPRAQPTPVGETSVLGTLKPRRRQASILHVLENNDLSIISPEDEEQFLPDDESTPVHVDKASTQQKSRLSTGTLGSASRKRKLGSDTPIVPESQNIVNSSPLQPDVTSTNHSTRPTKSAKRRSAIEEDDIMALPQSSSPESSPQKPKAVAPSASTKPVSIPTTEQLQSLMPSKRRRGTRQRNATSEFDIPTDSDAGEMNEAEDESVFLPKKRASKSQTKPATTNKGRKAPIHGTPVGKSKISKSTSIPPAINTPRTPLPLTRNTNQENKAAQTKSQLRSSKPSGGKENTASEATTTPKNKDKPSGGSRPTRRGLRSGTTTLQTGAESDKENSDHGGARSSRKRTLPADTNKVQVSIEDPDAMTIDPETIEEPEILVPSSFTPAKGDSADVRAWKNKWADIDQWDLDYEEVDVTTGSSSPLVRASVV